MLVAMDAHTSDLRPLDRRVRTLWWCAGAVYAVSVVVAVAVIEALAGSPLPAGLATGVVAVGAAVAVAVVPVVRYRRWRYALRADDLEIRRGVVWTTVSVIPYARLQFVDTKQGPLDRLFGLAALVVHTAAPGTSGSLPGLDARTAEGLRERLAGEGRRIDADVSSV